MSRGHDSKQAASRRPPGRDRPDGRRLRVQEKSRRRVWRPRSAAATKAKVNEKEAEPEKEAAVAETPDSPLPLLDLSDAAVKKMIKQAKKRGYVTHEQLNAVLPSEEVSSDQIEDIYAMLNEMGINVVEQEEGADDEEAKPAEEAEEDDDSDGELVEAKPKALATTEKKEPSERTDDPVRMYLREMGSVELLSREGEIAIAKRIEAGREAMIAGLCESPLTFQAIIIWRDELNNGKVFLRDIIDLEATYAGPDAKNNMADADMASSIGPDGQPAPAAPRPTDGQPAGGPRPAARRVLTVVQPQAAPPAPPRATPPGPAPPSPPATARPAKAARPAARATATSTTTTWRIRCRSPRSRPSSSRRWSRPSTRSPTPTSGCAGCRTRTSSSSSRATRCRPRRSASTRSSRKRSSPR